MLTALELPALDEDEAAHSARVSARIREAIEAAGGWIPFSEFMRLALYAPGLGYYSAGARRFGPQGDFITAPELSPLFARCLAHQLAEVLAKIPGGTVLEVGAGDGTLAADLLRALDEAGACPARYAILEVSASLRERQRQALTRMVPTLVGRVTWLDQPPAERWAGVVIANEVLDALPVERFRVGADGVELLGVALAADGFRTAARPAGTDEAAAIEQRLAGLPERPAPGFVSEACLWLRPWLETLAAQLSQGVMLLVDYGLPRVQYYHPSRAGGTLCAFFRHRLVEDPYARVGLQDLTAWVDFTEVAEVGSDCGLDVAGFTTQAHFLLSLGLGAELEAAAAKLDARGRARLSQAAGMLMLPGEMGERFKVMALSRALPGLTLKGFSFRDHAATL